MNDFQNDPENTFRILMATDIHLGFKELDADCRSDSFETFEEILKIACKEKVDFVLLGGDLFHENKPSRNVLHQCMRLLRKYCMGDRPVEFEFLSDQSVNFQHNPFPVVNYEDPNLNISLPIFSINGNHDEPSGYGGLCSLDLLSDAGLVNYFGKCLDLNQIEISPILLQKGNTKLCLYGLGSIRDERLHRLFKDEKVKFLRPHEDKDDWFNIFVLHQNRVKHGLTGYIPEQFLPEFLNLVFWGHEHECRLREEWISGKNFYISQPGSSVATQLSRSEAIQKQVGILHIKGKEFHISEIPLKTVRQFYIEDIDLEETELNLSDPNITQQVTEYCKAKIEEILQKSILERNGHPQQPKKPLIRLRVYHPESFEKFNVQRFGQSFVDRIANPKDILLFVRKKAEKKPSVIDQDALKTVLKRERVEDVRVEDIVHEYFQLVDEKNKLCLLSENGINNAVQEYVDKEVTEAITVLVNHQLTTVQQHLKDKPLKDETLHDEIEKFKEERMKSSQEINEFHNALKNYGNSSSTNSSKNASNKVKDNSFANFSDDDDESTMEIVAPKRGRGRGSRGGRGSSASRGRGRAKLQTQSSKASSRDSSSNGGNFRNSGTIESAFQKQSQSKKNDYSNSFFKNSSVKRHVSSDSDVDIIDDDDDDYTVPVTKKVKTSMSASKSRRGIQYDSD